MRVTKGKEDCTGDFVSGTACRECERCKREYDLINKLPISDVTDEMVYGMGYGHAQDLDKVTTYDMYYSGWECDSLMWVLTDGRKFTTNHGSMCNFSNEGFAEYKEELQEYLDSIKDL